MRIDLHSHSTCSDGHLSPAELVARAVEKGVNVLALTDHDTVDGIALAQAAIDADALPLHLLSGVEISCTWDAIEVHVVGLQVDTQSLALLALLESQAQARTARGVELGNRLEKNKLPGCYEGAVALANGGMLTRSHFAHYLVEQKHCKTMQNAFDRYLSRGARAYVPHHWASIEEVVTAIHAAGGVAVLAHPGRYKLSTKWLKRLLVLFKEAGGDAIEVSLCQQSPHERSTLGQYCRDYGFMASVGSDFHTPLPWVELGKNLWLPKDVTPVWHVFSAFPDVPQGEEL